MNKSVLTLISAVGLAQLGIGCKPAASPATSKLPVLSVSMVQPKRGDILRNLSLPGNIVANQQATIYARITGHLKTIAVDKGGQVKEGELLAEIEAPELLADAAKSRAEFELSDLDYKRATEAQKKAPDLIVSQSIDAAKSKSAMAKANLDRAETLLGFCRITAPFAGYITKRFLDVGAFVPAATAGASAQSAALVTLSDFHVVRVQIFVPEPEVPLIKEGLPVRVSVEGFPGKPFQGTVTRLSQGLDETTRTMLAEVDLENTSGELRPGMFAAVKVGVENHTGTLLLPIDALLVEKAGSSVFTVSESKAKKLPVKTGFNDGVNVEILQGVEANQPVIVVGKLPLVNGQTVNVMETK